jgi:hypothetical protein
VSTATFRKPTAAERYVCAVEDHVGMTPDELEVLRLTCPENLNEHDWLVIAIHALDQAGIDPQTVVVR